MLLTAKRNRASPNTVCAMCSVFLLAFVIFILKIMADACFLPLDLAEAPGEEKDL